MSMRVCLWTLLATAHLIIVVCGACDFLPDSSTGPLAQMVQRYGTVSGARSQYGFFAPEVGDRYRARFILADDQGLTWHDSFEVAESPEVRLRLEGTAECAFANGIAEKLPACRKRLVKSWAAAMFTRHPGASSLTVVVEAYDIPTMAEYRTGSRRNWRVVYQAQLQRGPTTAKNLKPCGAHERTEP